MNGVHDLGGMQDMGPVQYEKNEPVFHAPWEGRVRAMATAMAAWRKWNLDADRYENELIPPSDYLRYSYYERWFEVLTALLLKHGMVTATELQSGTPAAGAPKATPKLTPAEVIPLLALGTLGAREAQVAPLFKVGQRVRARVINPTGHTRLPRYARGKVGVIQRDHGVFVFPDTNAHFLGEKPEHVYAVRFSARELWGEHAKPQDSVNVDMWDSYLEPA
jgi:nitrile hydratase beta subunit